eukprot:5580746-Prymnesium_polylepis.2
MDAETSEHARPFNVSFGPSTQRRDEARRGVGLKRNVTHRKMLGSVGGSVGQSSPVFGFPQQHSYCAEVEMHQ